MAKVEVKGRPNYNKFDLLDSDVLEAILQADFDAPEAEQLEAEEALYIANLLAERQKMEFKDPKTLMKEFFEYYYPCERLYDLNDFSELDIERQSDNIQKKDSENKVMSFVQKSWRRFASAVAVLVLLGFGGTVTAYALGYEPIRNFVGRWNDDQFWFEPAVVTHELADLVADYAGELKLVPEWLPENYVLGNLEISELPAYTCINADFYREMNTGTENLYIDYSFPLNDNNTPLIEKDTAEVELYEIYGTTYYIMEDLGIRKILWRDGNFLGSISGNFSLAEAKMMVNSIYGE